ncbi:CGNR zinc finger domain-containing protein [Promicromonospora iranensis]|uniref:RNA-binding Zn ribbon-like protein n=1 Tax=Promicromonospora iranensis TaxID=1105144 RepID=A0ABU2CIC5_9MICO|nr:ABATE domain-containing protein [Promicromonospora iranensis]MDR7381078.1 putative RNA-binding Zn ribbon-like protein [Promicromonospora iranensis]
MPSPSTPPAELPPPAPGAAEHRALDLANSLVQVPGGGTVDALATPGTATAWLVERDLAPPGSPLQEYCASRLTGLRGQIRELFRSVTTGAAPSAETLDGINAALRLVPATEVLRWEPDHGLVRAAVHPVTQVVEHAMAALAADAVGLVTRPEAASLAACSARSCSRFFLRTHARRHWCSTRCGNRVRAARAYARRSPAEPAAR